jgi:hypothetical protein
MQRIDELIVDGVVWLPHTLGLDLTKLWISRIDNLFDTVAIQLSYRPAEGVDQVIASASAVIDGLRPGDSLWWQSAPDWVGLSGGVELGQLPRGSDYPIGSFDLDFDNGRIRPSRVIMGPPTLSGLVIRDGEQAASVLTGQAVLQAGDGIRLRIEEDDDRRVIVIDAVNDNELTASCDCGQPTGEPIYSINGVAADENGNINIAGLQCVDLQSQDTAIYVANPCSQPCCGCESAEALTANLQPLKSLVAQNEQTAGQLLRGQAKLEDIARQFRGIIGEGTPVTPPSTTLPPTTTGP